MSDRDPNLLRTYVQNITDTHSTSLKVVHLNAQSLNNASHQSEFVYTFSNCGIDIICVSETWLKSNDQIQLPGYISFNVYRCGKSGGGVSVFIRSCYSAKVLATSNGEPDKPEYIIIDISVASTKLMFAGLYRPPKVGHMDIFLDEFYRFMINYKYTLLVGDLNARFGSGSDETIVISDVLRLCNLHCVPFKSTFHSDTCDSNLDVISSNCQEHLISFGQTTAPGFSAHDLIYSVFDLSVPRFHKQSVMFRNFKRVVVEDLLDDVANAQWQNVYQELEIDRKLSNFNTILLGLMDKHAPQQTKTIKQFSAPWMSKDILKLLAKRNKLRKIYLRSKSLTDLENFRTARNTVKQLIRSAKIKYYYDKFGSRQNTSAMWSTIRTLGIGKSSTQNSEPVISVQALNSHYASVSTVNNPDIVSAAISDYDSRPQIHSDLNDKFYFTYAMPSDIAKAVNSIKSKAVGVDQIPVSFLKICLPALLPVLDHLFNFCLQNGVFPSEWKMANIIPIPKNKNPKECKDYRPVSILCVLGKALEKIVHKQVTDFLSQCDLFTSHQSGFRKGHSTVSALVKITDDIRKAIDKRLVSLLVLLDLSKAFDCVHHDLLLAKMKYLGFSDSAIKWFRSYLGNRCHRVYVSDQLYSEWVYIITGVPQGSVLGPLLFLVYIFDLPMVLSSCLYHMYADDIQLYVHFPIEDFVAFLNKLIRDINNVVSFCGNHNLVLNVGKTQAIILGTQRYLTILEAAPITPLIINGCTVPYCKSVNNLGVLFDPTLTWTEHCISVIQKVFCILAQLRRNFAFIPPNIRQVLISSLVMPRFDYGSVLFTDMPAYNNLRLQRAQNACIRFITGASPFEHITPYYRQLGVLKIIDRRTLAVAILVFKIIKYNCPTYLLSQFNFVPGFNVRGTRSSNKMMLQIPIHRTQKYHLSFLIQASKIWNDLKLYNYVNALPNTVRRRIMCNLLASM